ncbi:DUF998 domain-containing protein [Microbacterium hominis]|uniref:DUF998 domain-containing protein n=1 Tax=Microbacterium hominis TaxID=162426 RepID=A0A7D4UJ90_9MICO|nr:DUF998 domain-containing protein [Microbacterium hominis]QKJ20848.1 DUF998 domain-containing protein [Microbacterium hominis]
MTASPAAAPQRSSSPARMFDAATERDLESLALSVGAVAFVVAALAALIAFRFEDAPISGPDSIGQFTAIASAALGFVAFVAGRIVLRRSTGAGTPSVLDVLDIVALAFAHAMIALLGWTLLAVVLEQAFIGATVFALPLLLLAGAAAAMTAYIVFFSATHLDLQLLAVVLAVFLVMGVLASMLTATDPDWWHDNLSALGMSSNASAWAFNITLIVAGFIVTTLARYVTRDIPTANPVGTARVRLCLVIVGIFLACVGIFHVDDFFALHTGVASGMAVAFGVLVINLPRWITGVTRSFVAVGWIFVAVIVVLAVLFAVQYYTLTAVELVAGVLVFTWIILFIRNAAALQHDADSALEH